MHCQGFFTQSIFDGRSATGFAARGGEHLPYYKFPWGVYIHGGQANGYSLCDMAGNVWEWVNDYYDFYDESDYDNPKGPLTGSSRILRGGSWWSETYSLRCANRHYYGPVLRQETTGFRLVR